MAPRTRSSRPISVIGAALRDITYDYLAPTKIEDANRPKRRSRAPARSTVSKANPEPPRESPLPPSSPPSTSSQYPQIDVPAFDPEDPFGFLQAERNLKVKRDQEEIPVRRPITPTQRPSKRKLVSPILQSSPESSSSTERRVSSPSPVKKSAAVHLDTSSSTPPHAPVQKKLKSVKKALVGDIRKPVSKRPTRSAAARGPGRIRNENADQDNDGRLNVRPKSREGKKTRNLQRAKSVVRDEEEDLSTNAEQQEQIEMERMARIEYFKALEGYKVEEEIVYVI